MVGNVFAKNPVRLALDRQHQAIDSAISDPGTGGQAANAPQDPKTQLEALSRTSKVPVNVLMALSEAGGDNGMDIATRAAAKLGPMIAAGKKPADALAEALGPQGKDASTKIMQRAWSIANEIYPRKPAPEPEAPQASTLRKAGDAAVALGQGVLNDGVVGAVRGAGALAAATENALFNDPINAAGRAITGEDVMPRARNPVSGAADWASGKLNAAADALTSDATKQDVQNSQITGDILHPSTISFGKDPSLNGLLQQSIRTFGSMAGMVAAAYASGGSSAVGAGLGMASAAGDQAQSSDQALDQMAQTVQENGKSQLENESEVYRGYLAKGMSPADALYSTKDDAAQLAALYSAPIGAIGGAVEAKLFNPAEKILDKSGMVKRVLGRSIMGAAAEGPSEAAEVVAGRVGSNQGAGTDQDLTQNTAADFILGALGGGFAGGAAGVRGHAEQDAPNAAPPTVDDTGSAPAPLNGLPGPETQPPGAGPSGPFQEAAGKAPPSGTAHFTPGDRFHVDPGNGYAPFEAEFVRDTAHGPVIREDDGTETIVPRADLDSGAATMSPAGSGNPGAQADPMADAQPGPPPEPAPAAAPERDTTPFGMRDGKPFPNAKQAARGGLSRLGDNQFDIQTVDGGYVVVPKPLQPAAEASVPPETQGVTPDVSTSPADPVSADPAGAGSPAPDPAPAPAAQPDPNVGTPPAPEAPLGPAAGLGEVQAEAPAAAAPTGGLTDGAKGDATDHGAASAFGADVPEENAAHISKGPEAHQSLDEAPKTVAPPSDRSGSPDPGQGGPVAGGIAEQPAELKPAPEQGTGEKTPSPASPPIDTEESATQALRDAVKVRDAAHDAYEANPTPENLAAVQDDAKVPVRPALKRLTDLVGHEKAQEIFSTIDAESEAARSPTQKVATKDTPPPEAAPAGAQAAAAQVNTEPTDGQKEAGNYQKGHLAWNGLGLTLENPKGSERSGVSPDGKAWSVSMPAHYGYFKRTEGADGDHVDFYMGDHENSDTVLMVDQIDPKTKAFDEHKVIIGAKDGRQARAIYVAGFSDGSGAQRIGAATRITVPQLKDWLANGDTSKPYSDKMAGQQKVASPAPKKPKRLTVKQANAERAAKLQAHFVPGAVVQGYGGAFDRVIAFDPGKDGDWSVKVQEVKKEGDGWKASGDIRTHRTMPTDREFSKGPVETPAKENAETPDAKPAPVSEPAVAPEKITDFGEKIGGARKDVWSGFKEKMTEAEALDVSAEPLSKSWPEPDYEKLIGAGIDPWTAAFIRSARDYIPRKPVKSWRVKGWAENVKTLRELANKLMSGDISKDALQSRMKDFGSIDTEIGGRIALYEAVGHSKSLKELKFGPQIYSMLDGVRYSPAKIRWEVTKDQAATAFNTMPRIVAHGATRDEALTRFKEGFAGLGDKSAAKGGKGSSTKFLIYSTRGAGGAKYRIGVKIGANYLDLRDGIADVKEARRIVAQESDQLQAKLDALRDIPNERRDENAPRLGVDHRSGADVTPEAFAEAFGFRGVEFGNWVEAPRRQEDLNNSFDALMDLASILDLPPRAMSLNGSLGLAFGARGSGGKNPAAAHYEPGKVVINLTKRSGRGSLAHEWFHAMDNYFGRQRSPKGGTYITDALHVGWRPSDGIRSEVTSAFAAVKRAILNTDLKKRSENLDKTRSSPYWATGIEMHARAFESYVIAKLQDQNASNDYLANVVNGTAWAMMAELSGHGDSYPYLKPAEIEAVRPAFDTLFQTIETRETGDPSASAPNVAMFMRDPTATEESGSPREPDFVTAFLTELAQVDDLFQNQRTKATTLKGVFASVDPSITFVGEVDDAEETARLGADERFLLKTGGEKPQPFWVMQTGKEVWINVSYLAKGSGGSGIYAAVSDYALNTGRVFIGDPEGLSLTALRRRTDSMLSTALKHGTTAHIEPHPDQVDGHVRQGVPALRWTDGDHLGNLESMIEVSVANLIHLVPEVASARYDFKTGTFRTGEGQPITDDTLAGWALESERGGTPSIGRATVKRGILLNTLAHTPSGEKPGLLERVLRQSGKLVRGGLSGAFYARPDSSQKTPTSQDGIEQDQIPSQEDLRRVEADLTDELRRTGLFGKVDLNLASRFTHRGKSIMGYFLGRTIGVSTGASAAPLGVLRHEIIHALRSAKLWGKDYGLFSQSEWQTLVAAARADKKLMGRIATDYPELNIAGQIEEAVAEQYRIWAGQPESGSALGRVFAKIHAALQAFINALKGNGFTSAASVFEKIRGGEVGGRGPDGPVSSTEIDANDELQAMKEPSKITDTQEQGFIQKLLTQAMGGNLSVLGLVPGRPLFAELGKNIMAAKSYLRMKEEMDSMRDDWHATTDQVAQRWRKLLSKNGKANVAMMDLMHDATVQGLDPDKTFHRRASQRDLDAVSTLHPSSQQFIAAQERIDEDRRRWAQMKELRKRFNAMPDSFKSMYREVRDTYAKMADAYERTILDNIEKAMRINLRKAERAHADELQRIDDEGLVGGERRVAIEKADEKLDRTKRRLGWGSNARTASLRSTFESNRIDGPYFPLTRYGDFFATVRDAKGKVVAFSRFESVKERDRFAKLEGQIKGQKVQTGVLSQSKMREMVDPAFVADVEAMISEAGVSQEVMDAIWQRWLTTLPEMSVRRNRIHRKGTEGYSDDAFRNFGRHMFHGAHQLARLTYAMEMTDALTEAEREAQRGKNPTRDGLIVGEMKLRHEYTMNPKGAWWSQALSSAAFVWYLAFSPASALANLTQTTVIGIPVLATLNPGPGGFGQATRQLGRALVDFTRGKGHAMQSNRLTPDEKLAMAEAYRRGTVDKSQSHDLAGVGESGVEYSPLRTRVMGAISFFFHHAERLNREVTFLAAYRMAKLNGAQPAEAIEKAADLTWRTHFDYQNSSRPRIMQGNATRVFLSFKNYQTNMLYRLFRDTYVSFGNGTAAEKLEARKQLFGITGSMMLHAGIKGTWLFGMAMMIGGLVFGMGQDDMEEEFRTAVVENLGTEVGGALWHGVLGRGLGIDLSDRIGMGDLWFRSSDRLLEGKEQGQYWLEQLTGAVPQIGMSILDGVQKIGEGNPERGIEAMLPKGARDLFKAYRYATDGATTKNGDEIVPDVSAYQALTQALGFTPAEIAERNAANNLLYNRQTKIEDERSRIVGGAAKKALAGQQLDESDMAAIKAFNAAHPKYGITADTIRQSARSKAQMHDRNQSGIALNPKLDEELRASLGPSVFD